MVRIVVFIQSHTIGYFIIAGAGERKSIGDVYHGVVQLLFLPQKRRERKEKINCFEMSFNSIHERQRHVK